MRAHIVHPLFTFHPERLRSWFSGLAQLADPKLTLASLVPFSAGVAIAFDQRGSVNAGLVASAFLAIWLIEVGKNAVNNLYIGPRPGRAQLLTDDDLINIGWVCFVSAAVVGTFVAAVSTPGLLLLAAFAAALAGAYAIPPLSLAERGYGEAAVAIIYGPGILIGSLLMLGGSVTPESIIVATTLGLLMSATVVVSGVDHIEFSRANALTNLLFIVAFAAPIVWAVYVGPFRLAAAIVGVPVAIFTSMTMQRGEAMRDDAETWTLATFALTGVALAAGIAWI